jgi:uncharacterized Zn-finger protein
MNKDENKKVVTNEEVQLFLLFVNKVRRIPKNINKEDKDYEVNNKEDDIIKHKDNEINNDIVYNNEIKRPFEIIRHHSEVITPRHHSEVFNPNKRPFEITRRSSEVISSSFKKKTVKIRFKSLNSELESLMFFTPKLPFIEDDTEYTCKYCGAKYVYKRCLINHMVRNHRKKLL